jgi:hypothetical protein
MSIIVRFRNSIDLGANLSSGHVCDLGRYAYVLGVLSHYRRHGSTCWLIQFFRTSCGSLRGPRHKTVQLSFFHQSNQLLRFVRGQYLISVQTFPLLRCAVL